MRESDLAERRKLLKNEFITDGIYQFPIIANQQIDLQGVELVGYSSLSKEDINASNRGIHFYIEDWRFNSIIRNPEQYAPRFLKYRFICSMDLSVWTDMNKWQIISQLGARRYFDALFQSYGVNVIPAVGWGGEDTLEYCFDGIMPNGIVAITTLGAKRKHKESYIKTFFKMCEILNPKQIICYGEPFLEMYYISKNILSFPLDTKRRAKYCNKYLANQIDTEFSLTHTKA